MQGFIDHLKKTMNVDTSMIIAGSKPLWNDMQDSHAERLNKKVEEVYMSMNGIQKFWKGKKYLVFVIGGECNGVDADIPSIRYILN